MSAPQSVADTALGLTQSELQILRQQQQLLAQQRSHQGGVSERGRGTSRHSQPSSRAASAASSQGPGRVVLDPRSLSTLHAHLDNLLRTIQNRIHDLEDATERSVQANSGRANSAIQDADNEIARMRRIIAEIDRLEEDFAKVKHIRDIIKQLKARVDAAGDRLDRSRPSHHGPSHGSINHGPGGRHEYSRH